MSHHASRHVDRIPADGFDPATTSIDYIVVGAGPGGAPLACRLARAGLNVLVLEAGVDSGASDATDLCNPAKARSLENERLVYYCPGLHASATEPELYPASKPALTSWGFKVTHYSNGAPVYYPRAAALGGCACHHAMISVYGSDSDWQKIADLTGDASWSPGKMRMVYQQIERLRYPPAATALGRFWQRFVNKINPKRAEHGERGDDGWLDVTMSNPNLAFDDRELLRLIVSAYLDQAGLSKLRKLLRLAKQLLQGNFYRDLDLNDAERMRENPEGIAMVPIAVSPGQVRRGPREFLLETQRFLEDERATSPLNGTLSVVTGIFVCRVVLEPGKDGQPPRAIGVEFKEGTQLYGASQPKPNSTSKDSQICYCRREVILSGGAFNTPQLLMLSGIGDRSHIEGIVKNNFFVDLPGVGSNLRDRCEISVLSYLKKDFQMLKGALFQPDDTNDASLNEWKAAGTKGPRQGIYTSNGTAVAILKRSRPSVVQPDLLILGLPAAFRGYYQGWSKDLYHAHKGDSTVSHNIWTWLVLKAYTKSHGSVRLRSADPFDPPIINFQYFNDNATPGPGADPDMEALVDGIQFVRALNDKSKSLFQSEIQPGKDTQPNSGLRDWIGRETWGHHPCGTCRIGADSWKADPKELLDKEAVLDSHFRVHGVRSLRVVDASVFPEIPGYFISVPIYMISEKAAACILNELSI